jgi:hypothetical protein
MRRAGCPSTTPESPPTGRRADSRIHGQRELVTEGNVVGLRRVRPCAEVTHRRRLPITARAHGGDRDIVRAQ